ncbi:hypothetical protein BaRGS_00001775 [Batillaria attramentaria]|uniref:Uncharacterized protein n=1 Tax=Batillaria attramentaria TaxID=370345 RepID=A0ABD0M511_9CAEN
MKMTISSDTKATSDFEDFQHHISSSSVYCAKAAFCIDPVFDNREGHLNGVFSVLPPFARWRNRHITVGLLCDLSDEDVPSIDHKTPAPTSPLTHHQKRQRPSKSNQTTMVSRKRRAKW